jgi:hypothetical protein
MAAQTQFVDTEAGGPSTAVVAGMIAGLVSASASVGAQLFLAARLPEINETAWSAFVAGIAGGMLYYALVRLVRQPGRALWALSLGIATVDSALIIFLPLPAGHGPHLGIPIDGLIVPIRQMAALAGMGHLGARHFPSAYLPADTVLHYIPAVAVASLVPWLAGKRRA